MARFRCFTTWLSLALFSSSAVCLLVCWALPDAWEPCLLCCCCCCFSFWFFFCWCLYVAASEWMFLHSVWSTPPELHILKSSTAVFSLDCKVYLTVWITLNVDIFTLPLLWSITLFIKLKEDSTIGPWKMEAAFNQYLSGLSKTWPHHPTTPPCHLHPWNWKGQHWTRRSSLWMSWSAGKGCLSIPLSLTCTFFLCTSVWQCACSARLPLLAQLMSFWQRMHRANPWLLIFLNTSDSWNDSSCPFTVTLPSNLTQD